jgi:ubiquinone/menaquinone biosynthesis C-methylase UbiE
MTPPIDEAVALQRRYYTDTAAKYETMHAGEGDASPEIITTVCSLLRMIQPRTLLDVGAGTGRGIGYLREEFPNLVAFGVEPVQALIEQSIAKAGVPAGTILRGSGEALPFADSSVDVVCSFAILHHVREPNRIVNEMLRVARKAVVIVDSNRFGQGSWPMRFVKLALYKLRLWPLVNYLKTGGKGYMITEGDGLAYSYSVYDSFACLSSGSSRLICFSAGPESPKSWFYPLLTSGGLIVAALKGDD